jgi:hypothetical protein
MRILFAIFMVITFTIVLLATPKAETWCIRDRAGVTSEICAFSSARDCIGAALVGPAGGTVCAQQIRRSDGNDRRVGFADGNFRHSYGPLQKRHGNRSKKESIKGRPEHRL